MTQSAEKMSNYREYSLFQKTFIRAYRALINVSNLRKLLSLIVVVLLWHVFSKYKIPPLRLVPTPNEVLEEAIRYVPTMNFLYSVVFSMGRVYVGFMAGCVLGIPLGLIMGWKRHVRNISFPVFELLRPVPILSWIPLSVIIFPMTELSIVFLVFLGAFFPVVLNTLLGVETVPLYYINGALSLGCKPKDIFRHVVLPGALPSIFTGMTIGIGLNWITVVAAEMVAGGFGLGFMTWEAYILSVYPRIILGMFSIGASGYFFTIVVRFIGSQMMPWRKLF